MCLIYRSIIGRDFVLSDYIKSFDFKTFPNFRELLIYCSYFYFNIQFTPIYIVLSFYVGIKRLNNLFNKLDMSYLYESDFIQHVLQLTDLVRIMCVKNLQINGLQTLSILITILAESYFVNNVCIIVKVFVVRFFFRRSWSFRFYLGLMMHQCFGRTWQKLQYNFIYFIHVKN